MLGGQWRGCQASVILARASRKENLHILASLYTASLPDSCIFTHANQSRAKLQIFERSKSSRSSRVSYSYEINKQKGCLIERLARFRFRGREYFHYTLQII